MVNKITEINDTTEKAENTLKDDIDNYIDPDRNQKN